jgi:hypothetical protein
VISNNEAFDRLTSRGGSVDPLLRKALLHLEERLTDVEDRIPTIVEIPEPEPRDPLSEVADPPQRRWHPDARTDADTRKAYAGLTFAELRAECKAQGLPAGGTRDDLIGRLESA